jgi:hypothetical protein
MAPRAREAVGSAPHTVAIHHINCGMMCPRGERMINGEGSLLGPGALVCHVLLIEAPDGLALVDTGFGAGEVPTSVTSC